MEQADAAVVTKPKNWLKPPRQCRTRFDEAKLRHLATNMAEIGQLNPIIALPSGEIIAGHRRWKAAMLEERITDVLVRIVNDPITAREIRVRRISENLQRSDLSLHDKWLETRGFREDEPGITAKEIAAALSVDASTITRYLCLDDCIEAVREAAKNGLGVKACYQISLEPPERQAELLAEALDGGAGQVAKARQRKAGTVPAERVKRCKFLRPSGNVVSLSGVELSLDEAASELSKLAAEMKAADKEGISIKTFMANCRDKAEAGV